MTVRRLLACLLSFATLTCATILFAQDYPLKVTTIVAPYPAGGSIDVVARIIGERLAHRLGQPVIVKNIPGASGIVGTRAVAKAAPDGYTLLLANPGPNAIAPSLYADLNYDINQDFAPVALVSAQPMIFAVSASSSIKSIHELVAFGRLGEQGTIGSPGLGVTSHLIGELFQAEVGSHLRTVPYTGTAPLTLALLRNEISVGVLNIIDVLPHIASGKLRALAISSARRAPQMPNVPTLAETVVPNFGMDAWYGVMAPAGTPKEIVARLHREIVAILSEAAVAERMIQMAILISPGSPEEFAERIRTDAAKYARIVKSSGIKVN
ncbi:MAG: tripartite tricarboxylate transporter substrate binding protein [Betaproteobacteria bacterium]|nr:tripartite tricarboxylate transporter substrate binding protein [Betaproteobacteria bacterium]